LSACGVTAQIWRIVTPGFALSEHVNGVESVDGLTVVDTDILIDAGRGIKEVIDYLDELENRTSLATSIVTQMELLIGCRNKAELRDLEQFLRRFWILKISEIISDKAVELLYVRERFPHAKPNPKHYQENC